MKEQELAVRNKITVISFICSIMVIYIHANNVKTYGIEAGSSGLAGLVYSVEGYWDQFIRFAVPFFFLISGFLFFRTFTWAKLGEKYLSRLKTVAVPYLVWSTIYYFYFVFLTNAPVIKEYINSEQSELSLRSWLAALWPESYYTLWFLKNLIIFIAAAPVIYVLLKNRFKLPTGLIFVLLFLVNSIFGFVKFIPEGIDMYLIGAYLAINHKDVEFYKNRTLSWVCLAAAVVMAAAKIMVLNDALLAVFFAAVWFSLDLVKMNKELPWWLKISFFTYVSHDMILELLKKLLLVLGGSDPRLALLGYIVIPLVTFVIIALAASILIRIKPVWAVLCGGRGERVRKKQITDGASGEQA